MLQFTLLCVWLMSLLLATFLGVDRGRWAAGLLLGLLFGPLGVIAAGLMQPSVACEGARQYELFKHLRHLRELEQREAQRRRQEKAGLEAVASALEHGLEVEQMGFAEGLEELARHLDGMAADAALEPKLGTWSGWLKGKAQVLRESPRFNQAEV